MAKTNFNKISLFIYIGVRVAVLHIFIFHYYLFKQFYYTNLEIFFYRVTNKYMLRILEEPASNAVENSLHGRFSLQDFHCYM